MVCSDVSLASPSQPLSASLSLSQPLSVSLSLSQPLSAPLSLSQPLSPSGKPCSSAQPHPLPAVCCTACHYTCTCVHTQMCSCTCTVRVHVSVHVCAHVHVHVHVHGCSNCCQVHVCPVLYILQCKGQLW